MKPLNMNDQKNSTFRKSILALALILPALYFGYIITLSTQNSSFVPQYNFLYVTDKNESGCFGNNYKIDPISGASTPIPTKIIKFIDNKVTLNETIEYSYDNNSKYCNDDFYYYDVTSNSARIIKPESLGNYELINDNFLGYDSKKDPDNFIFKDGTYTNNISPIFYEGDNYSNPTYSLTKQFSNKILNIQGGRIRLLGFIKK
jgi:hypothetical protein